MGIKVNYEEIEKDAKGLKSAAEAFEKKALNPEDTRTTIKVNGAGKRSFDKAQSLAELLGRTLGKDAEHIENMGETFQQTEQSLNQSYIQEK